MFKEATNCVFLFFIELSKTPLRLDKNILSHTRTTEQIVEINSAMMADLQLKDPV